ncbi:hypothetical protein [Microvirga sp. VF16]|uniref:hypothetical protein n=1 Tax=Microvirga sp. VF16 TaxID=2807101 RepID=UPI00193CA0DD|nr:hypothetical protein [Microvirga sp. VF16]QRM32162.1 hypothetical protein JO965_28860 [Microvirga sp. VF16]
MAVSKRKETFTKAAPAGTPKGKLVARPPRLVQGDVDYNELIKEFMKQYPKTRAYLAK